MENWQGTEIKNFLDYYSEILQSDYEKQKLYQMFIDIFKANLDTTECNNFNYIIDALEKIYNMKIKASDNIISDDIKDFLQQFFEDQRRYDFEHSSDFERSLNKLKNVNSKNIIDLHNWIKGKIENNFSDKIKELTKLEEEIKSTKKDIQSTKNDIESTKELIYKRLEDTGSSIFVSHYLAIQNEEKETKNCWLMSAMGIGFILLILMGESLHLFITSAVFDQSKTIFKSIYIFVIFIIFLWLSRQYALSKRQFLIYRHLASAINSYSLINESISEHKDLKKALLCEVAKTIFPIPDGKAADSQSLPLLQILDLAKNVTKQESNNLPK